MRKICLKKGLCGGLGLEDCERGRLPNRGVLGVSEICRRGWKRGMVNWGGGFCRGVCNYVGLFQQDN